MLQLPGQVVMILALFGLGLLSKVYYSVQSQRLNIEREFYGFSARMMNAKVAYEGLTNSQEPPGSGSGRAAYQVPGETAKPKAAATDGVRQQLTLELLSKHMEESF